MKDSLCANALESAFTSVVTTFIQCEFVGARCAYQIAGALWCTFLVHHCVCECVFFQPSTAAFHLALYVREGFCLSNICSNAHVFHSHTNRQTREKKISLNSYDVTMMMIMTMYDWFNTLFSHSLSFIFNFSFLLLLTLHNQMYILALKEREKKNCCWYTIYKCIAISDKWIRVIMFIRHCTLAFTYT